jgi:hypothetical protein
MKITLKALKIQEKFSETNMRNPNKVIGAHERYFGASQN